MKKNIEHLKINFVKNFQYIINGQHHPYFKKYFEKVLDLVLQNKFQEALETLDEIKYKYSYFAEFQDLRNMLINMAGR